MRTLECVTCLCALYVRFFMFTYPPRCSGRASEAAGKRRAPQEASTRGRRKGEGGAEPRRAEDTVRAIGFEEAH